MVLWHAERYPVYLKMICHCPNEENEKAGLFKTNPRYNLNNLKVDNVPRG
jgi:hypothetical protein